MLLAQGWDTGRLCPPEADRSLMGLVGDLGRRVAKCSDGSILRLQAQLPD